MKTAINLYRNTLTLVLFVFTAALFAQEEQQLSDADALAKQLQNPVASLISVPFQFNYDFGYDPLNGNRMLLNVQPVVPLGLNEDWNLIARVILPVIWQNDVVNNDSQFGIGDAVISGFFSPKQPTAGGLIWGVGPVILAPTASQNLLGGEKFGVGPTAVALQQAGSITFGALVNHIWSVAGDEDRADINTTFFQPFIGKNIPGGYAISVNTEISQDWDNSLTNGTLNIVGSKVITLGSQMAQVFAGPRFPYGNGNRSDFGVRFGLTLLFPK
ncbi:hypothetical protein [Robertkochia sediminum]|uniref:hypothetical protein n=1 Tax=Robertkochia sediminum TaxID=2785326 RepID=UPI001931B8D8|nr:hypothetical protein [Robertkochia sediminum]MBL7472716.1 transporter [Robertkochia sediminum]